MITPYRILPINNLLQKCDLDTEGYINETTFPLYDDDIIDKIMDFTFLNVLFITPRFKFLVGYELINIKNTLLKIFGDDVIIYECTDSEMSTIIKDSLQKLTFQSLIIKLYNFEKEPTSDSIVKSIDDLSNEEKIVNTVIYFLYKYRKIDNYDPIGATELSYGIVDTNEPVQNTNFYNDLKSVIKSLNYTVEFEISDIVKYFDDNNIVKRFILDYYIDDNNNLVITLPENIIVVQKDTFYIE